MKWEQGANRVQNNLSEVGSRLEGKPILLWFIISEMDLEIWTVIISFPRFVQRQVPFKRNARVGYALLHWLRYNRLLCAGKYTMTEKISILSVTEI